MTWEENMMERMTQAENTAKKSQYRCDNLERSILISMSETETWVIRFTFVHALFCILDLIMFGAIMAVVR